MHGHSPGYALVVKADVDSMGGVIDGGAGNDNKTSPRRAAIEKAQAELRQEYDVREERRRELEFLEKGGNPLDFRLASATSVSVQSTSFTDQLAEQFVTSEAKGSFALTASPHGDSVESIGRPGAPLGLEPNSSDNLLHFGGGNELIEGEMNSRNPVRKNKIVVPNQFSYLDGTPMEKKSEDSPVLPLIVKNQAYRRRNRSRTNRDNARASTNDLAQGHNGNDSSNIPSSRRGSRETKGSVCENHTQKARMTSSICSSLPTSPKGNVVIRTLASDCELDTDLEDVQVHRTDSSLRKPGQPEGETGVTALKDILDGDHIQHPEVDSQKTHGTTFMEPDLAGERVGGILAGFECSPSATTAKTEDKTSVSQLNGSSSLNKGGRTMKNEGQPESSFTQINQSLDGSNIGIQCPDSWNVCSNGNSKEQFEGTYDIGAVNVFREKSETKNVEAVAIINDHKSVHQNNSSNSSQVKFEGKILDDKFSMQDVKLLGHFEGIKPNEEMVSETLFNDKSSSEKTILCPGGTQSTIDSFNCELTEATLSGRDSTTAIELPSTMDNHQKIANKAREDSILEEARIVEAKRKRIAELSVGALPFENLRKSHWDFVVEEMAWLANDFMQERLWKISAAAQICNRIAFMGRLTFDEKNLRRKQRQVAHTLAKAVLQFWHSAAVLLSSDDSNVHPKDCKSSLVGSKVNNRDETPREMIGESNTLVGKCLDEQNSGKGPLLRVHEYAVRFLDYNRSLNGPVQAEAPVTPDKISDFGILDMSWEDQFSEESLFYMVPFGAMETYRKSVESQMVQSENTGSSIQEEVETSMYDTAADFISHENAYEEEGETSTYYMAGGFVASKPSKFSQKKHRSLPKSYATNSHRLAVDLRYGHCMEGNPGNQQSVLVGKRPASSPHVGSVPTKRVRTAARQRGPSPFNVGATVGVTATNKTDISSGDTSSFQDDQSTLHGGSQSRKIMEVESTGEFGKQLPFDCKEISTKPKKKKKAKHLGSAYEQRWQLDTMVQSEERDTSRKRLESHHFESNGSTGLFGQHVAKKPKIKHSLETSLESFTPVIGSVTSPAASQMSNMSNPNKLFKTVAGRDRGRKNKILKISPVQSGLGSPWSLFEDQALVVLVHDMGPNWELVSDAINSTLQFKCIFRKPKECKERHKILMDRNTGDGADSAEDSGSSQPYPSTLPGIPKGSARQLFQRLQGPMEEDTLKAHFEKIIFIGKQLSRSCQNDNQDQKQRAPVHSSHVVALSQICLNKLNGGPLTPLDFCDATSGPDAVSLGYQGSQTSGLAPSNQGSVVPLLHNSGANSMIPGSSNIILGNNLPSPSAASNVSHRDGRYSVPRATSLSIEEQQKMQQYSQMFPGRNIQQPSLSVPGPLSGNDRAVRMLPGGSGMGMICGMNRVPMPRPGYQGISSPSMLNSASMVPSNVMGLPSHVNMHAGAVSGQGNSMFRSHEPLHMMRPGHNPDDQRQMMMPDIQMQVTQGNSQSINGLTSAFSNQTIPPIQAYPLHHQQQHQMAPQPSHVLGNSHHSHLQGANHATSPQHQSLMLRLAKERHLQRLSQQQQQKFGGPNALMPHAHSQAQHAISSSLQNGFQIQQQSSSQPVSQPPPNSQHMLTPSSSVMTPISSQHQQKYQLPPHGLGRNLQAGGGFTNQMLKQRQRQQQQIQQPGRQHPQQRQQSQTQQQAKLPKGLGKGTMMMHQNLSNDPSHVNGLRTTSGNQAAEKGEQALHLIQGQGLCSGSGSNTAQLGKQLVPPSSNQCSPQQKLYTRPMPPSSKQLQQMPSVSDNSNPGQAPPDSSCHTVLVSQQMFPSLPVDSSPHHQQHPPPQPQPRHAVQSQQTVHRMIRQNHQVNSDTCMQSPVDQIQANQKQVNNVFQMDTNVTIPQSCTDSTRVFPVVSSANALQWKAPEPAYDSDVQSPVAHLNSIGNLPLSNSAGSEPVLSPSRSSSQRQFLGGIPAQGHNVGAQRQQHLQSLQQPPPLPQHQQPTLSPPLSPQEEQHQLQQQQLHYQHDQQNHQLPPQQSPAQQQQQPHQLKQSHLHYQEQQQAGQGSLYARPTNSGLG